VKKTSLYIEDEVDAALERLAEIEGVAKAEVIRRALRAAASKAPRARPLGRGIMEGPGDLVARMDDHLADGFGR
jgi:hypothetical protein